MTLLAGRSVTTRTATGAWSTCGGGGGGVDGGEQGSERPVEQQTRQTADADRRHARPASSTARPTPRTRARTDVGRRDVVVVVVRAVVEGRADAADARDDVDGARRRAVAAARSAPDAAGRQVRRAAAGVGDEALVAPASATPPTHHRPVGVDRRCCTGSSLYTGALDRRRSWTVDVHVLHSAPLAARATGSRSFFRCSTSELVYFQFPHVSAGCHRLDPTNADPALRHGSGFRSRSRSYQLPV